MTSANPLRLWHPSFDAYHCTFRLLRILTFQKDHALLIEKLWILDFYLLYPALLHKASMPSEVRRTFRSLEIQRLTDEFVQLPSGKSLYRDLAIFQRAAGTNLVAKDLFAREQYLSGLARLKMDAIPRPLLADLTELNLNEARFMDFLVNELGGLDLAGARGLRALTGLVRRQP
ncbi:ABC-three component system middle component 5 [Bradyrhizobium sp. LTSP857]|uniref:ABC-three component system middle component 5 n=1 Tax=Bradyrhizobium sp. LTSP857 TaxID=1619231 RepID=UPI0005D14D7E|nr:ABC-three component system middle component 5 [Bradyrhizobium sp. LTSP857]KJC48180.1 hypothetical protein UP06_09390 [Bradyrhizobium sp. LTSP857]